MTISSESYHEYNASCDRCHKDVLEVIEYMDIEHWDSECGVCPKCKKLFCRNCVKQTRNEPVCPDCGKDLLFFYDCDVYDLIAILEHDCQPFEKQKEEVSIHPNQTRLVEEKQT